MRQAVGWTGESCRWDGSCSGGLGCGEEGGCRFVPSCCGQVGRAQTGSRGRAAKGRLEKRHRRPPLAKTCAWCGHLPRARFEG